MEVLWLEQSVADVSGDDHWLSAGEKLHFDGLRFPKRRSDWRLGRWTAKHAVAAYLHAPSDLETLATIEIRPAPSGAPEVFLGGSPANVCISISHRANVAVCAVAPCGAILGCDLELVEPHSPAFIADYFTTHEQAMIAGSDVSDRDRLAILLWSAKESSLKALHLGLRADTRSAEVKLGESWSRGGTEGFVNKTFTFSSTAPKHSEDWYPLSVSHDRGQCFRGWWMCADKLVRTMVAAPSAAAPRVLSIARS